MNEIPVLPDSAVVACDGKDVFVSFHWQSVSDRTSRELSMRLAAWLKEQLIEWGNEIVEEYDGGLNE